MCFLSLATIFRDVFYLVFAVTIDHSDIGFLFYLRTVPGGPPYYSMLILVSVQLLQWLELSFMLVALIVR